MALQAIRFATCLLFLHAYPGYAAPPPQAKPDHPYRQHIAAIDRLLNSIHSVHEANLSPDGTSVLWQVDGPKPGSELIRLAPVDASRASRRITAGSQSTFCDEESPLWSPDGKRFAFLSDCRTPGQLQLFVSDLSPAARFRQLTHLTGHLANPRWSPDGTRIAFLFVDHAARVPSPMAAIKAPTGVIDDQVQTEIQRIAVTELETGKTRQLTAPALYAFEFDWSPDSRELAFTGAPPPGDDNWYVAQLYTQALTESEAHSLYKPELQIALPRWSPDGKSIAFISGLMSDEDATGGDLYLLPSSGGKPRNLTSGRPSSAAWFAWRSRDRILLTEFKGGWSVISSLNLADGGSFNTLWEGGETINAGPESTSLSVAASNGPEPEKVAVIRSSWSMPPEVWSGPVGAWRQISRENAQIKVNPVRADSVSWTNDSFHVQGWLVYPANFDPSKRYPMIVSVHGGPAWIFTPGQATTDFDLNAFTDFGFFLLFPNPRGSYGQGESFTQANRRDWGFGDLDDIVAGVNSVIADHPIDGNRVGIIGWSYGGSTSMFAVARTHRFRAAVAGAGACNLVSYYGENSIDQWMLPYFGASVYDDPAAYIRNSALTYVKQANTPTLIAVGERDGEAPPSQSFEFWHALKTLHVPTQLVVYPGEGHAFESHEDRVDLIERSLEWFMKYMPAE